MADHHARSKVISSLFWKFMERGGTQGIQFLVQIILARLLAPEQFGTIALVMVFINLARVFVQSGFNTALIQKKDADEIDFSSVFYLSIAVAGVLYFLIYLISPLIAGFYDDHTLIPVLRVLSLTLFFGAYNSIQNAYIARNLMFKKLFISSLGAMFFSGILGIIAAYQGLGIWALIIQQLANQISITVILMFVVNWKPKLVFSFDRVTVLFSYGGKLLASQLMNVLYHDLRTLIIGRVYTPSMLGYYSRGQQFPRVLVSNIDGSIQSVMLPTLAVHQDNRKRVKEVMRRAIMSSSFLVFPMMFGMAVVAEPLVKVVLTDKWLPATPFLQIFCMSYALMPIHTANLQAINALGRSDIFLKLEIIKKILGLVALAASLPFGVYALAIGQIVIGLMFTFVNAYPNKRLLNYSYLEQWMDIGPSLLISVSMGILIYPIGYLSLAAWQILFLQVIVGGVSYFCLARFFDLEAFRYLFTTIKQMISSHGSA